MISTQPVTSQADSLPKAAKPEPKYMALRYDDDFSYLDGPPDSYVKDFFDPIKYIHIAKDWTISLGGEARTRMESITNGNFGTRDPTQDSFLYYRGILHSDIKYRDVFRLYLEGIDARVADRDLPELPAMENTADMNQLFTDLRLPLGEDSSLTSRVGRQILLYGKQRLIGTGDWTNAPRRFDGAKLIYKSPKLDIDAFWTKPVYFSNTPFSNPWNTNINEGMDRKPDHWYEQQNFYAIYSTFKGIPKNVWDLYFIGLNDRGIFVNANNRYGDLDVYTIGSRFAGTSGNFDYDMEGAGQWGKWVGDDVKGWMFGSDAGYTFNEVYSTPRLGLGFDYATGDDNPRDNSHETFNQLYPLAHAFLGYADLVARQNIIAPNMNIKLKPLKNVTAKVFWYHFWLDSDLDALYNAAGVPTRRNATGSSGNYVGNELDATLVWQIDVHSSIEVGYCHFWPGSFIETSGASRDANFFYLQYQFNF